VDDIAQLLESAEESLSSAEEDDAETAADNARIRRAILALRASANTLGEVDIQQNLDLLLEAFEQFGKVFKDKPALGKMVRNALRQTLKVSVARTSKDMLKLFNDIVKASDRERVFYQEGKDIAHRILRRIIRKHKLSFDDVTFIVSDILRHRIILSFQAEREGKSPDDVIKELIK